MKINRLIFTFLSGFILFSVFLVGCENRDPVDDVGDNIEKLGEDIQEAAKDTQREIEDASD